MQSRYRCGIPPASGHFSLLKSSADTVSRAKVRFEMEFKRLGNHVVNPTDDEKIDSSVRNDPGRRKENWTKRSPKSYKMRTVITRFGSQHLGTKPKSVPMDRDHTQLGWTQVVEWLQQRWGQFHQDEADPSKREMNRFVSMIERRYGCRLLVVQQNTRHSR